MDVSLLDKCCLAACAMGVYCHEFEDTDDGETRTEAILSFAYAASAAGRSGNAAARAACYGAVWTLEPGLYIGAERIFAWFMEACEENFGSPDVLVDTSALRCFHDACAAFTDVASVRSLVFGDAVGFARPRRVPN